MAMPYLLAIDQGTTGTRAVVYNERGAPCGTAALELTQYYPAPGWVEHDAEEIWRSVKTVVPLALADAGIEGQQLCAIGLTNQRETSVLWDRQSGASVHHALVWQDRRTTDRCRQLHAEAEWLHQRTGLILDPYFSATKLQWVLDADTGLRTRAEKGLLAAGTIDSFLLWRLTGGKVHATDVTNASRTLLLDLQQVAWEDDLCRLFSIPRAILPEVRPSAASYGATSGLDFLPDGIPICGVAGDQQAALFGQCGFASGEAKCTYGTGAFFLQHLGGAPTLSRHRLVTSLAATTDARPQYVLEGSVFIAGAAVQWLRDGLKLIAAAPDIEELASRSDQEQPILFVPGLVGLGAPYWVPEVRGVIFGLTRATTAADLGRAALEGVALQVADLVECAARDAHAPLHVLRVDGGMSRNARFLQCQADFLGMPVLQAAQVESTALGAAYLAGLHIGVWPDLDGLRKLASAAQEFTPRLASPERERRRTQWKRAVEAVITFYRAGTDPVTE